jgi:protein TonB
MQRFAVVSSHFIDGGLFAKRYKAPQRLASIGIVGLLHVTMASALLHAFGVIPISRAPDPLTVTSVAPPPRTVENTPPKEPLFQIPTAQPVAPELVIEAAEPGLAITPGPVLSRAPDTGPQSIAGTHTIPDYPVLSRRLNEEGVVGLILSVGVDGRVSEAGLTRSSGFNRLDEAARLWIKDRWRYRPALKDGQPVPSKIEVSVRFTLR